jgi:hypothetical protein
MTGDCERDCRERCAYPGLFAECGVVPEYEPTNPVDEPRWQQGRTGEVWTAAHLAGHGLTVRGFNPDDRHVPDGWVYDGTSTDWWPVEVKTPMAVDRRLFIREPSADHYTDHWPGLLLAVADLARDRLLVGAWADLEYELQGPYPPKDGGGWPYYELPVTRLRTCRWCE